MCLLDLCPTMASNIFPIYNWCGVICMAAILLYALVPGNADKSTPPQCRHAELCLLNLKCCSFISNSYLHSSAHIEWERERQKKKKKKHLRCQNWTVNTTISWPRDLIHQHVITLTKTHCHVLHWKRRILITNSCKTARKFHSVKRNKCTHHLKLSSHSAWSWTTRFSSFVAAVASSPCLSRGCFFSEGLDPWRYNPDWEDCYPLVLLHHHLPTHYPQNSGYSTFLPPEPSLPLHFQPFWLFIFFIWTSPTELSSVIQGRRPGSKFYPQYCLFWGFKSKLKKICFKIINLSKYLWKCLPFMQCNR